MDYYTRSFNKLQQTCRSLFLAVCIAVAHSSFTFQQFSIFFCPFQNTYVQKAQQKDLTYTMLPACCKMPGQHSSQPTCNPEPFLVKQVNASPSSFSWPIIHPMCSLSRIVKPLSSWAVPPRCRLQTPFPLFRAGRSHPPRRALNSRLGYAGRPSRTSPPPNQESRLNMPRKGPNHDGEHVPQSGGAVQGPGSQAYRRPRSSPPVQVSGGVEVGGS